MYKHCTHTYFNAKMELKVLLNRIIFLIVKVLLPTYDVYGDCYIVYQLMLGSCFATDQQSSEEYKANHVYLGIIAIIPLLVSFLFHIIHWWEMEKVENGGQWTWKAVDIAANPFTSLAPVSLP